MTTSHNLSRPRFRRSVLIIIVIFLALGLIAGAAVWYFNHQNAPVVLTSTEKQAVEERIEAAQYEPGVKSLILTQREINGLINEHTKLGEDLKVELADGALHARIRTTLPEDFPVLGGKTLKMRARFLTEIEELKPSLILDDLTVYGISLPNAWLGELKGKNLLGSVTEQIDGSAFSRGIEKLTIQPGFIEIQLAE